jgi:hypothetical protein
VCRASRCRASSDGNAHVDPNCRSYADIHRYVYSNVDAYCRSHTDSNLDAAPFDADSHAYPDQHGDGNGDGNGDAPG